MESLAYNIDCMEYMKTVPDKWFDLAVVDPPYGIGVGKMAYLRENKVTVKQKNGTRLNPKKRLYTKSNWDDKSPDQSYYDELVRVSKNQIIWGIEYMSWVGVGIGRIKWDKCFSDGVSFNRYETAYCSMIQHEEQLVYMWAGMFQGKSLSEPMTQQGDKRLNEKRIHPTQKPVQLYSWIYRNYLPNGGIVIDTHLGSGSNRIAADKAGNIDFYSCEIDKEYFEAQEKRYKDFKKQLVLF